MTKAKKGIMWSLIAVLAALLVALAAIGITFARYSSSGEGSGSASVAKWDVSVQSEFTSEGTIETFSPSEAAPTTVTQGDETTYRKNTSSALHVAQITNSGDVTAEVTIGGVGTLTYVYDTEACTCDGTSCEGCVDETGTHATGCTCTCDFCAGYTTYASEIDDHFELKLYSDDAATTPISDEEGFEVEPNNPVDIYATVTWTSDTATTYGDAADAFDTWVGHYLDKITFTISFTAVQTGTSNVEP